MIVLNEKSGYHSMGSLNVYTKLNGNSSASRPDISLMNVNFIMMLNEKSEDYQSHLGTMKVHTKFCANPCYR